MTAREQTAFRPVVLITAQPAITLAEAGKLGAKRLDRFGWQASRSFGDFS
jgi:hypothetical protein